MRLEHSEENANALLTGSAIESQSGCAFVCACK